MPDSFCYDWILIKRAEIDYPVIRNENTNAQFFKSKSGQRYIKFSYMMANRLVFSKKTSSENQE